MNSLCRGCVVSRNRPTDQFKPEEKTCPGGLDIYIRKCPCKTCLVKMMCKTECNLFSANTIYIEDK